MPIRPKDNSLHVYEVHDDPLQTGLTKVEWDSADGRRVSIAFGEHVPFGCVSVEPVLELEILIEAHLQSEGEENSRPNPESELSVASSSRARSPSA